MFAAEDTFKLLSGELKSYVKTAESGALRVQMFCPECGTHIYATSVRDGPKTFGVRVGTTRQRSELRPTAQYWCRSALDWVTEGSAPASPSSTPPIERGSIDDVEACRIRVAVPGRQRMKIDGGCHCGHRLDVFESEPMPADHPFWDHPKITITPHASAVTLVRSSAPQIAENYRRLRAGEPLLNTVGRRSQRF